MVPQKLILANHNGPKPQTVNAIPTDAVTYKAGQPGYYDSDGKAESMCR